MEIFNKLYSQSIKMHLHYQKFTVLIMIIYFHILYQQETPLENLNYAFDVAEKHLDIPKMLDAEG